MHADKSTFKDTLEKVLSELRESKHATTEKTPFELMFGKKQNTISINLKHVLDGRRLIAKGHWRSGPEKSYNHLATRDSESDTDDDFPLIALEANKQAKRKQTKQQ